MFPILPFLFVWLGSLASARLLSASAGNAGSGSLGRARSAGGRTGSPRLVSRSSTGPRVVGRRLHAGQRLERGLGPGLIALRRAGGGDRHSASPITAPPTPSVYGIDYVPYLGGAPEATGWR
jgi:hypothetical protein